MTVSWEKVELAMRRGKLGQLSAEDQALCARAFEEAPDEYRQRKRRVDDEVHEEKRRGL